MAAQDRVVVHTTEGTERFPPNARASEILQSLLGSQAGRLICTEPDGISYMGGFEVPAGEYRLVLAGE